MPRLWFRGIQKILFPNCELCPWKGRYGVSYPFPSGNPNYLSTMYVSVACFSKLLKIYYSHFLMLLVVISVTTEKAVFDYSLPSRYARVCQANCPPLSVRMDWATSELYTSKAAVITGSRRFVITSLAVCRVALDFLHGPASFCMFFFFFCRWVGKHRGAWLNIKRGLWRVACMGCVEIMVAPAVAAPFLGGKMNVVATSVAGEAS